MKNLDTIGFTACVKDLQPFDQHHDPITVHYIAFGGKEIKNELIYDRISLLSSTKGALSVHCSPLFSSSLSSFIINTGRAKVLVFSQWVNQLRPEDRTIARLRHLTRWPHVTESKSALDSGFHTIDSGFQCWTPDPLLVELGFRIPIVRGIPDSLSCIPDSTAKICRIPLYGARLEIPESFNFVGFFFNVGIDRFDKEKAMTQ